MARIEQLKHSQEETSFQASDDNNNKLNIDDSSGGLTLRDSDYILRSRRHSTPLNCFILTT
jgi:hypothetical protein